MTQDFVQLNNEQTRDYFERFLHIVDMMVKITKNNFKDENSSIEDQIVLEHLLKLQNTMNALSLKFYFNGLVDHKQKSLFHIDIVDSGYPLQKEVISLEADVSNVKALLENIPSQSVLKEALIECAISQKSVNVDVQYDMAMQDYLAFVSEKAKAQQLFFSSNDPVIIPIKKVGENQRFLAHWSSFDVEKNIPNIYIMAFEYSGKGDLSDRPDVVTTLKSTLLSMSSTSSKLLSIAKKIDDELELIHPKSLKRIHVGPIYKSGVTQHNDSVEDVLSSIDNKKNSWILAWTSETLLSEGSKSVRTGMFGEKQEEIFYVDSTDFEAFEAGATDLERSMILPYESYQALSELKDNPLNGFKKFIVSENGEFLVL